MSKLIYINNGIVSKKIPEGSEIPEGFVKGRLPLKLNPETQYKAKLKRRQTCLERYGNATYNNPTKNRETCLQRYGTTTGSQTEQSKQKAIQTSLLKYNARNPSQSEVIKNKIKQSNLERFGVEYSGASLEHKQKVHNTWKNKSQEEVEEIVNKRAITCIERYGCSNACQSKEIIQRISTTCQERYGVDFFCMTEKCRSSSSNESKPNANFAELLKQNNIPYEREFTLNRCSYDFKVNNYLIEIDPSPTHNSTWSPFSDIPLSKTYHYDKSILAKENGYHCIHIWDWDNQNKIIELLKPRKTIPARKCIIKEIDIKTAKEFLNKHHLQDYARDNIRVGLFYNDELVSVMTFGKPRYNKNYNFEIIRYCSKYNIIGGANKLFKYFIKTYNPSSIISYCDRSKFSGQVYIDLGFREKGSIKPSKHWYNPRTNLHITDNLLRQRGFDQLFNTNYGKGTSNEELMLSNNFVEIYDAGQATYIWQSSF